MFGGTGLGLVLTRYLAEAMGGSFHLEKSALNEGSTFVATVSMKTPESVVMVDQSKMEVNKFNSQLDEQRILEGKRILVVEDSPDNQSLFTILLNKAGAFVELAGDGRKGVDLALDGTYDVVLMDIQMPVLDGHSATRELRRRGYAGPVIALTAHAMKEEQEKTKESGFTTFLTKPVQRDSLISSIANVINVQN
jgi:CheY-like chemotaxis protein